MESQRADAERRAKEVAERAAKQATAARQRAQMLGVLMTLLALVAGYWAWESWQSKAEAEGAETRALQLASEREIARELAEVRTREALTKESLLLAHLASQQTEAGDAVTGMLLALRGLPTADQNVRPYAGEAEQALASALWL